MKIAWKSARKISPSFVVAAFLAGAWSVGEAEAVNNTPPATPTASGVSNSTPHPTPAPIVGPAIAPLPLTYSSPPPALVETPTVETAPLPPSKTSEGSEGQANHDITVDITINKDEKRDLSKHSF